MPDVIAELDTSGVTALVHLVCSKRSVALFSLPQATPAPDALTVHPRSGDALPLVAVKNNDGDTLDLLL